MGSVLRKIITFFLFLENKYFSALSQFLFYKEKNILFIGIKELFNIYEQFSKS